MTDSISRRLDDIASTYATDSIVILGKGPSADEVDLKALAGSLVIALNDAEQIAPADITIFRDDWVKKSLSAAGRRSRFYLTSCAFDEAGSDWARIPREHLTQESADLMLQRLQGEEIVAEDVLFMTALQAARAIARIRGRRQTVHMIGFDFAYSDDQVYSSQIRADFVQAPETDRRTLILMQENYLLNAMYMLQESDIEIRHVGRKPYSALTASEFNQRFAPAGPDGADYRTKVTGELTTNHFGDRRRLERMIRAVKAAGADYVKVQKRDVDTFYTPEQLAKPYHSPFGETFADYRYALELSRDDFEFIDSLCRTLGIDWFVSVLDKPSFEFLREFERPIMKLPSTISEHRDYLDHVARTYEGSIVLSTGMTDEVYEGWVLETFTRCDRLYLMQANSAYPTPLADCGIGVVRSYHGLSKDNPRIVPAYSSHDFGWFGSALAVSAGARMVEKHVKLGNTDWAHFDAVALDLTTPDFRDYVQKMREAEAAVGDETKTVKPSEHHKYWRSAS
jgi:sialic acid synthase SpsE